MWDLYAHHSGIESFFSIFYKFDVFDRIEFERIEYAYLEIAGNRSLPNPINLA